MSDPTVLNTVAGPQSADKFIDGRSIFDPMQPAKAAPYARTFYAISPQTAASPPSTNVRFTLARNGVKLKDVWMLIDWAALPSSFYGTATALRYVDYLGYMCIKQARLKYGVNLLQTLRPDDMFLLHNLRNDDEKQSGLDWLVKGGLTVPQRDSLAKKSFFTKTPLSALFFSDAYSKALDVYGLNQELVLEVDFEDINNLIHTDGTYTTGFASNASFFVTCNVVAEYYNVLASERAKGIAMYRSPKGMRLLFNDIQYHPGGIDIVGTTALSGQTLTFPIMGFSKPAIAFGLYVRWADDLTRNTTAAAGPSNTNGAPVAPLAGTGRDNFNVNGWLQPLRSPPAESSGWVTPLIQKVRLYVNNYDIVKQVRVEELIYGEHRFFLGSAGGINAGILIWPFDIMGLLPDQAIGPIDFSQISQPQLDIVLNSSPNGYSTVNAYATADIGGNSDLMIQPFICTLENIDEQGNDLIRPYA